ncbi:hypothetical protein QE152_g37922 [Popillia japonica]|uniref:Uncharacterized protein n=1 Tax=Popillia japonica TaxID=7064 RepID=A0AAW1I9I1_POPJA
MVYHRQNNNKQKVDYDLPVLRPADVKNAATQTSFTTETAQEELDNGAVPNVTHADRRIMLAGCKSEKLMLWVRFK